MKKKLPLIVALIVLPTASVHAQGWDPARPFLRSNAKFRAAFKEVIADARQSTVRVRCDGKDTALGMIVGPGGWVLTKYDDLNGFVTCRLADGRETDAHLVGVHERYGLAMLKIDASDLTPISFGHSDKARAGNWVATVGVDELPITFGVVGVATRKLPGNGGPISVKKNFGFLGVRVSGAGIGLRVEDAERGKPAFRAGIRPNDILLEIEGNKITAPQQLIQNLMNYKPGQKVTLTVKRGDKEFKVAPKLADRPMSRGEKQNRMGSVLSERRTGYPVVLQHDAVVKPSDCGGPLVDLNGDVVGINISRVGRTETHALPAEIVEPVLFELMAGKYPPPESTKVKEKTTISLKDQLKQAKDKLAALERLVDELRKKLKQAEIGSTAKPNKNESPQERPQGKSSDSLRPEKRDPNPPRLNPFPNRETPPTSWIRPEFRLAG